MPRPCTDPGGPGSCAHTGTPESAAVHARFLAEMEALRVRKIPPPRRRRRRRARRLHVPYPQVFGRGFGQALRAQALAHARDHLADLAAVVAADGTPRLGWWSDFWLDQRRRAEFGEGWRSLSERPSRHERPVVRSAHGGCCTSDCTCMCIGNCEPDRRGRHWGYIRWAGVNAACCCSCRACPAVGGPTLDAAAGNALAGMCAVGGGRVLVRRGGGDAEPWPGPEGGEGGGGGEGEGVGGGDGVGEGDGDGDGEGGGDGDGDGDGDGGESAGEGDGDGEGDEGDDGDDGDVGDGGGDEDEEDDDDEERYEDEDTDEDGGQEEEDEGGSRGCPECGMWQEHDRAPDPPPDRRRLPIQGGRRRFGVVDKCKYYDSEECLAGGSACQAAYCRTAVWFCRLAGNTAKERCVRQCLLDENHRCQGFAGLDVQALQRECLLVAACEVGLHLVCFARCDYPFRWPF